MLNSGSSVKHCQITTTGGGGELSSSNHHKLLPNDSSSSGDQVASNIDLLLQILVCLPVKSLLVFKSVSKQWFSIISDPSFIRNHWLQNQRRSITAKLILHKLQSLPTILLHWNDKEPPPEFEFLALLNTRKRRRKANTTTTTTTTTLPSVKTLTLLDTKKRIRKVTTNTTLPSFKTLTFVNAPAVTNIVQSCNGLLLCSDTIWSRTTCIYYIYNPATKQYRIILNGYQAKEREICSVSLAFDPLKSPDHYQVVCIWRKKQQLSSQDHQNPYERLTLTYQIEIYSSKTSSWRLSGDAFTAYDIYFYFLFGPGVFWNGCLHWISEVVGKPSLYFDLDRELLKTMPMPPVPEGITWREIEYFGECKGHLQLIENYDKPHTRFDIMEMDTEYTGWNVKYRVNLEQMASAYPDMFRDYANERWSPCDFKVWLVVEAEEESSSSNMILQLPNKAFSCNLKEMKLKKILEFESPTSEGWLYSHRYVETLAPV